MLTSSECAGAVADRVGIRSSSAFGLGMVSAPRVHASAHEQKSAQALQAKVHVRINSLFKLPSGTFWFKRP